MATMQDAPTKYVQYVPLVHVLRRPLVRNGQGKLAFLAHEGGFPWIMTSMLPADLGPTENPDDFLPEAIDESGLNELTLAVYKARSSASPYKRNRLVHDKIMPRLVVAEGKEFKANTLNNRDQSLRKQLGVFTEGFHVTRLVNGVKQVPAQVAESAKKHSPFQWLHRTWGIIDLKHFTYRCGDTIYQLRAPQDLPPKIVELFKELNLMVPKVRDYLEARHDVWKIFFPQHYLDTEQLRKTNPSAFPPLPGYVLDEGDFAQHAPAQEQHGEEEQGQLYIDADDDEEEGEWHIHDGTLNGDVVIPEEPMFGNAASNTTAMEPWWEAHLANLDHLHSCPIADASCHFCKNIYEDVDFEGNLNHTLGECSGMECEYCKQEQEVSEFVNSVLKQHALETDRTKFDHVYSCPVTDGTCDVCKKVYEDIDLDGNLYHTLDTCPGTDCEYCNQDREIARSLNEIVE